MKRIRRFLQVLLFINLMAGLHGGMKIGYLALILVNGVAVILVLIVERRK